MTSPGWSARETALQAIDRAASIVGAAAAPRRFFEQLEAPDEPYELGVAVPFHGASPRAASFLVYYNPRTRAGDARARMVRTLAGVGFDTELLERAFERVAALKASTVLGLTWHAGKPLPVATLYLEEVSRFWPPDSATRMMAELAGLTGGTPPDERDRVGALYIWAFDVPREGQPAFKVYRSAGGAAVDDIRAELRRHLGGSALPALSDRLLFGHASDRTDYILQRRYDRQGKPAIHKVYRCFSDYLAQDPEPSSVAIEEALAALTPDNTCRDVARIFLASDSAGARRFRPTSVGLAFAPGVAQPRYGTGYWCLLRAGAAES